LKWQKLALNGARMVKITLGGENFVLGEVGKWRSCVSGLLINDLSRAKDTPPV